MKRRRLAATCLILLSLSAAALADMRVIGVRFHGNHSIPDDELQRMVGLSSGDTVSESELERVRSRLLASGRFESVEVRRRYASLDPNDAEGVVLVIAVVEKTPFARKLQFFPILGYTDEYGLTYGARATADGVLGAGERISFPLSWGGVRRAASELRFPVRLGIADFVVGEVGLSRRENPAFEVCDRRGELKAGIEKHVGLLRFRFDGGWSDVSFGPRKDRFHSLGGSVLFDSRQNVVLPRDAVYAGLEWKRGFLEGTGFSDVDRFTIDLRAYKALRGRTVLATRALLLRSGGPLPEYLKPFIGGGSTLRGYSAGAFVGDNAAVASVELRIPTSSPGDFYRGGFNIFFDTGTVSDDRGLSPWRGRFRSGVGGGVWIIAFGLGLKAELGYDLDDSVRAHFGTGFSF